VFDAGTDSGRTVSAGLPGPEQPAKLPTDFCQVRERLVDVVQLQVNEVQDVLTWRSTGPLDRNEALDFIESKAEPARLCDESEQGQRVRTIHTVARSGTASGRQNAGFLVQAERFPTHATLRGYLTDQQAVSCHGRSVNPVLWDKVKRILCTHAWT
jgi:hypothetical protein